MPKNNKIVSTQKKMRTAFQWIDSIYNESEKLLDDALTIISQKCDCRIESPKESIDANKKYSYAIGRMVVFPEEEYLGVLGIGFFEEGDEKMPKFIIAHVKLSDKIDLKKLIQSQTQRGWGAQYLIYDGCINLERNPNFYIKEGNTDDIFFTTKANKENAKKIKKGLFMDLLSNIEEIISTWVPLASMDSYDRLDEFIDEEVIEFLKNGKTTEKLREKIRELRDTIEDD